MKKKAFLIVLAHPDDETLIGGTIATLAERNIPLQIVYATSGDAGDDATGNNLSGKKLAAIRENELRAALQILGMKNPPALLKFNDGSLKNHTTDLQKIISDLFDEYKPTDVISFGPDGVTGHLDHITVGAAAEFIFDKKDFVKNLFHIAVSETKAEIYNSVAKNYLAENPVCKSAVNIKINVEQFFKKQISAAEAHKTQFTENDIEAIKMLFSKAPYEEYIIARSREKSTRGIL